MPWAMVTAPAPSTPKAGSLLGTRLSGGGSQVHSVSAWAPVHTLPGSLGLAGDLLLLFAAFAIKLTKPQYIHANRRVSTSHATACCARIGGQETCSGQAYWS